MNGISDANHGHTEITLVLHNYKHKVEWLDFKSNGQNLRRWLSFLMKTEEEGVVKEKTKKLLMDINNYASDNVH